MRRIRNLIFLYICAAPALLCAQGNWKVDPMLFSLQVLRGDTLSRAFSVLNESSEVKRFQVVTKDWVFSRTGEEKELEQGENPRGCASWVTVTPRDFTLGPGERETIRFSLSVPRRGMAGSHWCAMYVVPFDRPRLATRAAGEGRTLSIFVQLRAKVSVVATVEPGLDARGEITGIKVRYARQNRKILTDVTFSNPGNVLLQCRGRVEIRNEVGETVLSFPMNRFTSLPGLDRTVTGEQAADLVPGEYSALAIVDFGGDYLVAGEAFFRVE